MCGIAGFADSSTSNVRTPEADFSLVHTMCEVIRHRGPDDEGVHTEPGVGLGMRRLSIIDLSTGHQPIHNEDQTVWVVFNGEIYNYRELRRELEAAGHRFYTSSDTETIVHAYEEWGEAAFAKLRGMFGIGLWDRRTRTLLLARDRAGQKPLHYALAGGRLFFGSEIKSLIAAGAVSRDIDLGALDHYLSYLYAPRDRAIFKGVHKLPPGHYLAYRDGRVDVRQYWQIGNAEPFRGTSDEAARALEAVLADAVESHMVSDVPLGAFLSGGVDSSVVVGLMARASSRPVKTFSIGFDDPQFDELEHARRVAEHFGTEHHEFVVRPDGLSILDRLIAHFDEPFADSSAIPDVVRLGDRQASCHRRPVRRWRRRAVRRLRPLSAAPAGGAVRQPAAARQAADGRARLAVAAAWRSRQELSPPRVAERQRPLPRCDCVLSA